jgi:hypothetical protein
VRTLAIIGSGTGVITAVLARFRLPVSGLAVELCQPTGAEDLLLVEASQGDPGLALALVQQIARSSDGMAVEWSGLCVSDLDVLLLRLRQALLGDSIRAEIGCRATGCGYRIDVSFNIDAYLAHHAPIGNTMQIRGWSVSPSDEPGWFCLSRQTPPVFDLPNAGPSSGAALAATDGRPEQIHVLFRLPTVIDQISVAGHPDAEWELARRCIRPGNIPSRLRRPVEAAMKALAPSLSGDLVALCPECGSQMTVYFDARRFCLQELRNRAAFVYEDIDVLAWRYRWSEREILALPNSRRTSYAELARQH